MCGAESEAGDLRITASQAGDAPVGEAMSDVLRSARGGQATLDKADESNAIRATWAAKGSDPVIPPPVNRLEIRVDDQAQEKPRHKVARLCHNLKPCRRVATRYKQLQATCLAFVTRAS